MSPFAIFLKQLRIRRGLKQRTLAHVLGYEASYLSALERSQKGPPRRDFVARLIRGLALDTNEQLELLRALDNSKRQVSLPCTASIDEYTLIRELEPRLGRLSTAQVQIIRQVLTLTPLGVAAKSSSASQ